LGLGFERNAARCETWSSSCVSLAERWAGGPAPLIRYATLAGAQLFVGAAAIFARFALGGAGPVAVSYLRLGIAAAIVVALAATRSTSRKWLDGRRETLLAIAGVALAVHFGGWIASLEFTSIAIATLLVCTSPIFTGIYEAIVQRRAPGVSFMLAIASGGAGLILVVVRHAAPAPIAGHVMLGAFLATLGAVAMSVYLTLVRSVRSDLDTLAIIARTYAWAAIVLAVLALVIHENPPPLANHSAWLGIIAMALFSQLLGHTAMNVSLRWFTPTTVGFATLLEPVIAAVLAALIFREALAGTTLAGAVLLFVAIALAIRNQAAQEHAEATGL
jgi:drug/metabolite transporter (DMT)-like permease